MATCAIEGCESRPHARGWCTKHYQRWVKTGDPEKVLIPHSTRDDICSVEDCTGSVKARNLCSAHYWRWKNGKPLNPVKHRAEAAVCAVQDCGSVAVAKGYCNKHYRRLRLYGDPTYAPPRKPRPKQVGAGHRRVNEDGYVIIYWPDHPNARQDGRVSEHTAVMSEQIGRPLLPFENVHHKNGIRDDNRPDNLELWTKIQPPGRRVSDAIRYANQVIATYGADPESF